MHLENFISPTKHLFIDKNFRSDKPVKIYQITFLLNKIKATLPLLLFRGPAC